MLSSELPINIAPPEFLRQLDAIEPGEYGTPCTIVLDDGRSLECCLAWENRRFGDKGSWINPANVAYVTECPKRLPAKLARIIRAAGESGMGYHICVVQLSDGSDFVHVAGNLVIDLLDLPAGYTQRDVVGVLPHAGRDRSKTEGYRHVIKYESVEYCRSVGINERA